MRNGELLRAPDGPWAMTESSPWCGFNLRRVGVDGDATCGIIEAVDATRNGHLEQWCNVAGIEEGETLLLTVSMKAQGKNLVGANLYLYFHPTDARDCKVYQVQHPGDAMWHKLSALL